MLTPKQNMLEVIKGGNPDRFVNQYEAVQLLFHPFMFANPLLEPGQENVVNAWGVTNTFPKGVPGSFPVHTPDKIVVKDIEDWKDYVHAPSLKFTQDQWDMVKAQYDAVDGEQAFKAAFVAPGLFEQTHHLCEISNALVYYITNPDEMHDLIKYLTEWEFSLPKNFVLKKIGMGAGKRDYGVPNIVRAMLVETEEKNNPENQLTSAFHDKIIKLETNIDDSTGEALGFVMEELFASGALDVQYLPCFMKKNRPAWLLVVLCKVI